jgi:cell wall-associated NlpC family hydrolase
LIDAYGIVRQTVLPVYLRPKTDSALVTQLLFGECYLLTGLTSDREWFKVYHQDSAIGGWVWAKSIKEITAEAYDNFLNQDFQVVTSPIAAIEYQGTHLYLLPGSRLHFSERELFNWQDHLGFTGTYRPHALKAGREELVDLALRFLHAPFQAGGRSIFGLDAQHAFPLLVAMAGYSWPSDQLPGKSISPEEAAPGDLMVVKVKGIPSIAHFAMYLGAEELLWMDHRMQVTDFIEWEVFLRNNFEEELVFETYSLVR